MKIHAKHIVSSNKVEFRSIKALRSTPTRRYIKSSNRSLAMQSIKPVTNLKEAFVAAALAFVGTAKNDSSSVYSYSWYA